MLKKEVKQFTVDTKNTRIILSLVKYPRQSLRSSQFEDLLLLNITYYKICLKDKRRNHQLDLNTKLVKLKMY
ncbi:hypothetical protein YTPLAS73_14750 [Nitrosarchaeum sp.]|nr:hypothetical protein YTPLAS73_14750 [Nitrosarchaeum sp.]